MLGNTGRCTRVKRIEIIEAKLEEKMTPELTRMCFLIEDAVPLCFGELLARGLPL